MLYLNAIRFENDRNWRGFKGNLDSGIKNRINKTEYCSVLHRVIGVFGLSFSKRIYGELIEEMINKTKIPINTGICNSYKEIYFKISFHYKSKNPISGILQSIIEYLTCIIVSFH